jgi:anti-anti-sigma factor
VGEAAFDIEELDPRSFRITGSLDVPSGGMLHELLDHLAGVTFMDSGGLRAVLQACTDLGDRGEVLLVDPSDQVRRLLEITGVEASCPNLRVVEA